MAILKLCRKENARLSLPWTISHTREQSLDYKTSPFSPGKGKLSEALACCMPSAWQRNKAMLSLSSKTVSVFLSGITAVHRHLRFWLLFSSKKKKKNQVSTEDSTLSKLSWVKSSFQQNAILSEYRLGTQDQRGAAPCPSLPSTHQARPGQKSPPPSQPGHLGGGGLRNQGRRRRTSEGRVGSGMSGESTECKWEGPWGRLG